MAQLSPASTPVTIFRALQLRLTPGTLATAKSDDFYLAEARTGLPIGEVGLKLKEENKVNSELSISGKLKD